MDILKFIFYLGIVFSIFQMLWWILNGVISYIRGNSEKTVVHSYILKALHYLFLMPVVVSFVSLKSNEGKIGSNSEWLYITVALAVTAAYLFGKIQKRQRINRFRKSLNMIFKKSFSPFNFKAELIISITALVYLLIIFFIPILHQNEFIYWLTKVISGIYNIFLIGIVFRIIGIVFVISIFWKALNGIRSLFGYNPEEESQFNVHVERQDDWDENRQVEGETEYTDYEEVEDSED